MERLVHLRLMTDRDTGKIIEWRNKDFVRKNFIYQKPFTEESHLKWIREQVETGHVVQFIICLSDEREIGSVYFRYRPESGDGGVWHFHRRGRCSGARVRYRNCETGT